MWEKNMVNQSSKQASNLSFDKKGKLGLEESLIGVRHVRKSFSVVYLIRDGLFFIAFFLSCVSKSSRTTTHLQFFQKDCTLIKGWPTPCTALWEDLTTSIIKKCRVLSTIIFGCCLSTHITRSTHTLFLHVPNHIHIMNLYNNTSKIHTHTDFITDSILLGGVMCIYVSGSMEGRCTH